MTGTSPVGRACARATTRVRANTERGKTRKGNQWLRMALIEAALAAIRTKDSALAARYRRVMRHRGHKKAVVAVAHAILRAIYHILAANTPYRELGPDYYDRRHAHRVDPPGR